MNILLPSLSPVYGTQNVIQVVPSIFSIPEKNIGVEHDPMLLL